MCVSMRVHVHWGYFCRYVYAYLCVYMYVYMYVCMCMGARICTRIGARTDIPCACTLQHAPGKGAPTWCRSRTNIVVYSRHGQVYGHRVSIDIHAQVHQWTHHKSTINVLCPQINKYREPGY